MTIDDEARKIARPIRGCATDAQYVELLENIEAALARSRRTIPMAEQYKPPREGMPTLSDEPVPFASFQAAVLAPDAEIAAQLRKLLAAYPLGTMDWPLDVMANAASALERRAVLVEALEKARDQFRFYEREHRQKYEAYDARCDGPEPPRDRLAKAETNRQFANMLDAALSRYRATPGQG